MKDHKDRYGWGRARRRPERHRGFRARRRSARAAVAQCSGRREGCGATRAPDVPAPAAVPRSPTAGPAPSRKGPQPPSPAGTRARRPACSPLAIARSLPASLQLGASSPRAAAATRPRHPAARTHLSGPSGPAAVDLVSPQTSLASSTAQTWVRAALCGRGADGLADGPGRRGNGSRAEARDGRAQTAFLRGLRARAPAGRENGRCPSAGSPRGARALLSPSRAPGTSR
nr:uncharacterized protein LOC116158465 [Camelus dromedarius]